IKARSSITMNNVTYTTQDEHGRAIDVTRNESVDSNDSATVTVTPQLQATTEGAVFIKGGDGFDFGHVERFIQNPPHGATVAWHDSPDTWKNTVGNTHKTAVVTLPSGQGTRNVEVPVKVYPVANAKAPSRDVKGQNLTHGTNAIDYITFDPNTNTNGITAAWANRQQPNNQQAGVQHLNVDVTYPGISAAKRVPVTVNVYQFEFPQTTYTTTVGGTLASGTQASGYAHMQNANGLPTDGFTYKWNNAATGTNDANWAAMNKPNMAKVVNAKYDVIYNGHTFATSLPAKFVVKDVQPAKPTVTETAAGAITIAPGANQTVNTHAGNVTTYADKLVIKRNGSVVTTFTRRNNTSPWVKEASAATVAGIAGTNNGITVAAGTFNPADTIQVVATQGSGETISDEQRSDDFTVVAPQPNQATTKIWQNGHIDITPNNPSGHLINPTQAMDIAYTEKVGNGAEHSKTINVVRGQNNQWTIANKPDYVTLDAQTGKVTFNANTIKPNSSITITPKAGTGHSVSSNPSTLTAPAAHTVNTTEIVKDYGSNVTAAEINNAVQVANKRTATIKNGTAMPTNLAGGSTTTIPVTVTYNDGSTEEVQESIFTKADKRELITAKNHLDDPVSTEGKKPGTITQYNNAMHNAQQQINTAKTEAQQVINNERATPQQVSDALTKVRAAQTKIDQAKALLQNKEDNSQLVTSKNNLQSSVNQVPSTAGMTQQSIDNYNAKKREAETEITAAQRVIDNGDATAQQISDEKHRVDNALTALNQAKHDLTADTHALEQAVQQLNRTGTTTGKKPASITAYNNSIRALQSDLTSAKNSANAIIQKPIRTVQEVQSALTNVNRVNERLTQAINQLVPLADNSALRTAKTKLDEEINKSVTTDGMTQSSIQAYENAKRAGQTESTNAQNVINNGDATDQQIAAEKTKVEEKYNSLKQAISGLTPDLAPLQTAKTQLQNDIDQPTSTTGMTSASVAAFNDKLSAARTKIQEIDRVLASHPDVATIRQNVTAANAAKSALDQARNGLTVDKAPLENAKAQLQQSIDTQTSTTGMTQDSVNAYNAKLTAARNKIQQINQVLAGSPTVDQINTNTSAANQAKSDLDHARQALTPDKASLQTAKTQLEQSINQPTDTTGMTTASLNAYNQKLQAARQKLTEINQVLNGNPTVQNINDKVAEANQAKDQLNTARQGLTLDRQPALTTLHGASNLNQAQQNNFTQQINAAQNHAALETIKSNITALNTAMTKLKDSVADNNTIKSGQNYTDATPANKQAYDNAVNAAKGVIGETTNPTMDVNTVNQKAASVKSTKDALDGQQNLQRAKTEATNAITHASDLNQAQKNALTQQVNSAQNVQAVNDIKQTTQSLNTAMTGLKRGVANHNQVVQSDNYVNADTNKKNDYNNAYNHANDIINGNAQHPVITPSDVNNALSNVTSKEQALNGNTKLNAAKQEANTALGHLNNLNNAQRQNLQSQINGAHQIDAVNTIKQNATNLNSAMGNLRQAVADKDQVKRTEDYADADTAKQNAYNSAVSSAETIINQTTNPTMSVDDVNRATSAVTSNKNALNGDEKLAQSKTDAARAIDALPHLNNAQKADVKSKINAASNIAGVNTVKQQGTDLNTAMGNLQGAINDEQTTLNSQNYQDATPSKKTAYTNAVQAAKDILNKSNGQNKTKDQVTEAMNQVNSAKNNLDGTRLLDQAKQTAKQQLNNMTHLTTAQKTNLTNQINSGTTVAGVHTVQSNANTLDQAMNTLRQSIANKDATKASEDYVDANNDKQTAYNNAVAAAETIINANSNPEMNPSTITQKAEQVNSSKTALNGDENLATAKQNAKTYLNTLTSITDAQKNNLISQISSATRVSGVDTVKQNAQHLDQAMASLQSGINNESQVKSSEKYRDADTNKQQEYDNAITAAKAILNKQHGPNTAQNAVEAALQRVNTAKDALNGDAKLIAAQNAAKQHLGTLTHITTAQRNDLTNQISQATNLAGVESVKQSANSLDGAMGNLQTAINDKSGTLASQNFLDADEQKRNAYNQAVSAAETILNKQTGPNTAKTAVEQALNNVNNAKHALNGTQNLNNAKQAAITAINGASDLNQHQKDALKAQANGAQRVSNAQDVQHNATELNTSMGTLKHAIADKTNTLASSKYVNADSTKQNAYTTKVTNAEHIISGTPTVVTTPSEVTAAANQVNSAKQELNGDERLNEAKQNANTAIDVLTQLNTPQKAKLKEQVGQANRLEDVQTVQTNGQALNNAMKGLRDSIANETTVKASQNYTDASPNNQSTYNSAVSNAKGIINQTNNPTMDTSAITQATTQVNNAKNGLNGAENLRNAQNTAKQNLNTLSHLTNNQKSAISSQIDRAGHVSEVTAAKNAATELNTQMGNLEQAIHDQNTVKQGVNFTDADKAKRDAYTNAVSRAEAILNKTQGANTSKQDVEAAIQNVTSAKNALNGDQNVTNAKNAAKNALNNLTSINNAQKRDLTTKIDQATTVAGVEAVSNTGTQLNTAMANLQNGINDKANTLASENYHDADSDKKTAYTQAVTNAENILNKNSGSNLDKAAVENALSQVANAKGALNGNHNLEQAKSNANTTINGLQHLTTAQKDKLKQQVQQAQNVAGVDNVKSSANTLNGAMGTLRNSIQDNAATKNGQNYLDATESNKTNYNNAVDSANGVINATSNPNMDAHAINQIATQVTSTKNALDGTHNLTQAKQTATNAIDGATNLNKAQKDALKAQVTSAQRVANVTSIQQTANELNTAMGQLQHGIDDENATKQTQKYRDAEQSKKTAYDQAVAAAKAILNKQTGSNSDKAAVDRALQQVTSTKDALNGDAKLAEAKAAAKQNLGTLNHITNAQRTDLEGQINQATTVDGVNTVKTNANTLDGAMNSLQGAINDKDATLRNQNYLDADESKRNAYTQAVTAAEGILNKQTGGNTSKADVDNALNAVTRAKAALNGAENLRNAKTSATNTINGLRHLTQLQKDNLKHQVEQAQNVAGVNGVKDKGNTLNTAMGALRTSIQNDNTTKTSQNYLDASDSNKNNYNTAVNNANGVINATNNPNMDANAINDMANQVNTTKAALNGAQNLAQAKTNATNTINNAHDLNQKQKDALKTQVNNAQRVSDANNVQHTVTELNGAMTALKATIADKERTKASGNYVNADQEKRQAYDSKVTNAENIINGTPNATLTVNDVNSAASQVNAAKTALNGDNNLRVAKEHANNTIDGLAQLNNVQKAKLKEQVQSATTLDGVQTVKNSSQTLNTAMKGLRDSIANEATIKAGQNYTDASPNNRNEYDSAVTAAKAIINQTSNPTMEPNTITQATSQVTTKEHALNGAQNLAQAKTTAKNNLNNLTSINNAQKDALTRSIDGATTVAGVNQETVKATELNNAMHSLQNGINDETQTKQTQKYLDAEPSKKSAYDQAVNAAKAILTKASGQNVDKAAVEQALQNVNSTKTALNGDAKLNEAKAAAKQTLGILTHINNAQRTALDNEITQATNVEGVNTVKAKAQQLDGAMGQLETSIRDKDTTLQSQNYQDADDAKRTAYSQAVNAAATILNKTAGGNTPKADVERAMQAVTQANTALNGIQNLERAKQAANTAITNASDLNTKQKEALKAQVTSAGRVSAANGVEHTATELNTAMTAIKRAIADKVETKASGNYVNADANKRQAYDEKVTAAEHIVSGTSTPTLTPSDVTNAATQVTNAKTQLNGNHNLEVAKQNANTAIDGLTSLNGPQKAKLKEQVGQATTLPNVQTVRDNAQTLNTAMKGLRDSIANEATIKADQNYTDASQNKQNDYNNAVTAAKAIIGQTTSPSMNAQEINQAKDQVTAKQQALNGQENLRTAQTNAKQHLNGLSDLTDAQKDAVKRQIEGATHVNEVTQAQNNADALNTAMTNLKNGIQDQNTIKQGVNFTDADEAKRNAYTNAVTQAEQILNKAQGPNTAKDNVESALQNVQRAKNELNGNQNVANAKSTAKNALNNLTSINNAQKEALKTQIEGASTVAGVNQVSTTASELNTAMSNLQSGINDEAATKAALNGTQNLEKAKQHANTAIDGLSHLTNAQKEALKQLVQQSTTVAEAQGNEQKANNVDAAMDKLRQSIADNATTKQNQNYTDASQNKKDAYNNAVTTAQGIIDQTTSPTLDPTVINQAAGQVSTTKNALNGNENLEAAKQQASQSLGSLDNLNNAQKQTVTDQINGAHTVDEANQIKQNAQNLNTAMGNLKQAIADKDATKATVNFTDADQAKQQAYNTAVTNAENIISKANGGNATQAEVEQAIKQVNAAKQALNGNANVQHAKDEATALINNSNDLNQAQKDALKQQVQNATTVAGVNNVKQTAQELNNAMTQLKQGIADKEQTKADGNFVNADPDKQNAYKQAVAKAEALISGTPDVVVTPSEITAALNKVTQAKNDLNGNTNLATAKQNVQHAIDQLPNLNQAQRDEYNKQITQATLVPNVNAIQQAATTLNDAMTQLKQGIANKAQIKGSENYHDADTDKQTAYDNAVTKAEELLKQTTNPTMDPNTIQQALTKVNDTNQALNGNQKLADAKQDAKTTLGTLDHLNDAQKQALTTQVEQAPDIATVNNVKQNAQNLNNAMTNLNNALQDKTETLNSINFTDADQAKKDAYTNAVSHAEGILSKANGSNASQTEVEQAMQRVNEAKQALNGNDNVQRAKDAAKQVITNANDLNQAMTQLKQGIADKDQTKANGNFVNADTDKQNAYNNAVAHAEQIISGTPNANVDPQQVAQALQQVNQAKGDLNGNHNLQVAKDNANTAIDQLPNLNQPQKTALKDQVSHAELVTGVNAIKQNADALNNAMGTLKQQIQANSQVPQSVDFTQADQDKQQAYNNAANQAQQIANGIPTPVLTPDTVTQAVTTMNQAKDALNGDEKLAQAKQEALANLDTLRDLNQPQRDALRNQINQAQALATVEQTKQNAQNVNTAMGNLKQGIANKDTVKASENYHDADADKQTAYTNAVSQAEGIINQSTNPTLNPDEITRALTQVTDAKNGLNGEAKLATEKQNAKDAVSGMTHLNDAQKQALKGQIDQSPEIATVNQVKQTATSLDHAMDQLSQAINDKAQTLADGNYLNADPDKQNAYKQAVAKAEALLNKQSGTNEVQAQVESITNEVNAAKQALNGNDNLANAKQHAKQQLANLTHLNDAQKQSFESQITQAPLVTDVTTINQKAQTLDHAMELLRNSVADNQTTLASEDYHDATTQRQNDYNQAVTAANNIIYQTTSPTMNPDDVNGATTQVNNTKVALDGDENLAVAKQQANNRLDQLDHLNNAQKQQLQSQITQSSDIAAVNGHKQTAESLNTAMGNLINAIADHQAVEQRDNFINADTDKQTAYNTAVNEAAAMINKQTGQNANQTEVEQAITKVQTTLQALNGDHNLQVAKTNATQAIDALTSLNDPQKTALKDQVTAATLVTAVHQIEQNANTLNQAMHGLRQSIQDNAATKANSKYINEDQPEQQNYDQAVQAANNIINEQTATLDNNAINQAAATVNTTKAALHGDVKLQNDKDHAKQTVSQLAHLNNAQKHMEDTLIDSETTRTAVKQDLTEAPALDQLMDALQQSIADKDATRMSSAYVNAEPNKKQAYDEAVQNAESIIAGLNNPTINKGNVSSATQAVTSSKNALDGVERLAQDKQTAGNSLNHLDQLTPAQQQALENQINNATTRDKVAEIIAQAQALNEAMKALKESIKDQPQTEASSKFINEDQAQKDAYTQAVQHAKDLINKTTDPTLAKSIIDQATQAVTDAKNNLHGDQKLAQDKQRATETLNNLSNLNTPQRQALENQINNAATRGEVAQKLTEAEALNQAMEALRNSIQDQQQTEAGSKFINEDKPQKDAYQAAVQNAKDLINQTNNPTLDKAQVEQLTQAVNQAKDNLHGDQKLADDKQHAVTDLNQLNGLNNPQRQALVSQINNAATRGEVAQKLAEAKALDQAMQALRNSIQDQQQTESGSKFINEDKPQKDAYQAAVQNAQDLINQTGNPTLDKSQVEQLTQAVTTAKDNLHGDQKLARDQQQAVTTVNALPNLNHAQQQALTDAINAAPTRTEVAQHVQTATELDHAMEILKNKVDQVNTDKAQPNYTEASTDKKEAVDQALQAAESITDPTNGSNANKDAVEQALTKLQEKENELNGNERVAEAKTQAKQTIDQLTHLNADQIATAKQNIDQATKLQPIAELVDQATQLNQSMDQLQQAVNEHANVEQTVDYTQADSDKQNAYKQAIADAENVLKQNANKQQVDQALQNILNAKQALNGDERVALAKTNGKHDIDQLNALNNAQQDGFKGRIDQSNDLNQIQQIVDEAKALNRAMDQLSQEITGNEGRTKGSTNYVNADTQVKQVYDEAVDKAKQALDKSSGQNLTAEQVIKLNDAVTAAKKALNGEERLNNRKAEALQRLDQLTHLNNAQRQLAIQQINNAETLNKASRAINRATKLDNAMGAVQQYIDEQHLGVISSTNYINADDNLKANYDNAIANAAHELDKVQGNAIAKAEAEQLKQNIIDAQNALNGDQNLANAKDKANAFVNSLNGLNQQQQDLAHKAINNAGTVSDVTDIVNNQIDLNDAMETLKHLVDNEIPNAEQTVNYQNADDNAKTNFDDAKRLANTLLNSDNTNVNDINGAIQTVNDAIHNLNGDQRLQDAKDKAIQSINQALANKLKEIEASNATDQDKLIAKNKAEELANSIINNINKATSNQAVSQVQTAGNHAIEQVHANEIPKAKIDANKDVDKQVQALIDEIDRNPNLTDKEKQALKDRINQILQQGHNDINNALTKEEIEQAKAQLAQALQDIKDLVKAKEDAKQDVDKQVQALIDEIDQNPNLTDKEKQALKDRINQILQQGHNDINNAMTKEAIEQAKERLAQALQEIKNLVKAKENAKQDVDKRVQALIDEIDRNPNLTDKEKQALKDRINQILQQGHNDINNAMTKEEIEQAKAQLAQALQDIKDLVKAKEDAKNAIKALANAKRDQINSNPDLTPEQKAKALKEIDEAEKRALQNVENAQTIDQLNRGLNLGLDDIRNTHVWEVDEQPAVNEIFEATPEQILVNGELIVHRDDIITEQDILAHINLIDQLSAEVIDTPSTATISDSLTAKVEVTLLDGSKVIVNVPVKVVEKELSVVKQQAIESIENAAQQKINEINNSVTLTLEQKEAAIAEVNKLKQQAIDHINNAPDVHSVEEIQQQEQAHIEQFNPEQFTIEQAKSNAIKSIEDAIQHMIDEIKARTDLTDKEKQEAIAKLNQLKEQAIQAIQRAQSIDEITEQLEQFKAQMKAANPTAKELAKRKQEAISRIKDFSNEKINSIRNSEIGTTDEKQAAMNQINEIVLETIRDINNAHTLQQVEAALNNGIARISAVQIVISDRAKQSSSTGNESNSHLTIGYGTANHPFNSSTIGHKKKIDEDDDIDPLHMRHFSNNFGNVIKNAIGVVGISGLLASFWFFIAKRRRKEDEEEELEIRDNNKDSIKETLDDTKHLPLLFAKRRRKEDEEDVTVEEKDSLNNGESLDKVKHTPFFLPKRRRKEDEEDVEVTNENTDEKVLKDNEHSPLLFAKRRKDKEEDVETTTSIESKDEDVPLLLAKKKNQKDNQSKDKKSASKNTSKKVAAKKKKKKSKKNKK
ncbi:hyperosmolarity resistance protein Ebh, partial [Staphylococcus aureus]|uniref:hyperosmolarity resistance protein Ebh n=1 Tax=Staphylococcus aureus TaxID=1280 RepID=UPI003D2874FC